jgi:hypothetical protein
MELRMVASGPPPKLEVDVGPGVCALCDTEYDTAEHDACPNCAERFATTGKRALDDHKRVRDHLELLPLIAGTSAIAFAGWLADIGATRFVPTFWPGHGLWFFSLGGGVLMGLLAGWRLRGRSTITQSAAAVCGITLATTVWLHAACVWANGFSATGEPQQLACQALETDGQAVTLQCREGDAVLVGVRRDFVDKPKDHAPIEPWFRRGRLGYWVAALRPRHVGTGASATPQPSSAPDP